VGVIQRRLKKASRETLRQTFEDLEPYLLNNDWLASNNTYRDDTIKAIDRDVEPGRSINHSDLAQYIAASGPCHCVDGWSYIGKALESHARGDHNVARHLGYYAELRAAMALLATEGIGIFNHRHFIVEASGTCSELHDTLGTHQIAWEALRAWAGLNSSVELLSEIVSPGGFPLGDWLDEFNAGPSIKAVGIDWLEAWGLDLQRVSEDRDARNEASYRPTCLHPTGSVDVRDSLDFSRSLWAMCAPSARTQFEVDRYLLRFTLEQVFGGTRGNVARNNPTGFAAKIARMLGKLSASTSFKSEWYRFLTFTASPQTPLLINEAWTMDPVTSPRHHIQVISRAALLLRVATGACELLFKEARIGRQDLEFWWQPIGENHGLWEPRFEPEEMELLWTDVRDAILQTRAWEQENTSSVISSATYLKAQAYKTSILGQCERVALWGFGL